MEVIFPYFAVICVVLYLLLPWKKGHDSFSSALFSIWVLYLLITKKDDGFIGSYFLYYFLPLLGLSIFIFKKSLFL